MARWLEVPQALALIGQASGDTNVDENAFEGALDAACEFVQDKRPELWSTPVDDEPAVFEAGARIKLGAAMLAHRLYERRSSPLGAAQYTEFGAGTILRYDPDIGRLLGIGSEGGFNFGGAGWVAEVVEEVS